MATFTVVLDQSGSEEKFHGADSMGFTDHGLLWTKRAEEDFRTVWAPQSWRRLEVASEGERQEDVLDIFRTD